MSQPSPNPSPQMPTWSSEQIEPVAVDLTGRTLAEFQVERLLGRGGMGDVYLANQVGLNRHVAIKVLRADFLSKPAYLSRFEIEATAIAKLNHANIVHVYTIGTVDKIRFIAMEYVQGTNLKDYVVKKGAIDLPLAFSIMRQAGQAISAAAEVGLIHRDIKPENILLTKKGRVKVADFGLCRDQDAEPVHLTQPGVTMGTPSYMSPEQAQGHELDHRSDLYSLGITFYFMLAGVPPFRGDTPLALAIKHVKEKPPNLRVHRPDIPVDVDLLVMKLMAKDPKDRFQSATEMLAELSRVKDRLQLGTTQHSLYGEGQVPGQGSSVAVAAQSPLAPAVASTSHEIQPLTQALSQLGRSLPGAFSSVFSLKMLAPAALGAVLVGAGLGWMGRSSDLLRDDTRGMREPPGLWLAADWKKIPRLPTPEQQYRRAQLLSSPEEQVAAWLAVPGYNPTERGWATKSYIQLGRILFREKDKRGLAALADDLERWKDPRGKEPLTVDLELARLLKVAAKLLDGDDLEGVVEGIDKMKLQDVYDISIVELGYEIIAEARLLAEKSSSRPMAVTKLTSMQGAITPRLLAIEPVKLGGGLRNRTTN